MVISLTKVSRLKYWMVHPQIFEGKPDIDILDFQEMVSKWQENGKFFWLLNLLYESIRRCSFTLHACRVFVGEEDIR